MKRKFLKIYALVLLCVIFFTMISCGNDEDGTTTTDLQTSTENEDLSTDEVTNEDESETNTNDENTTIGEEDTTSIESIAALSASSTKEQVFSVLLNALNAVKVEKPGFSGTELMRVESLNASVANSIVNTVKPVLFPETPIDRSIQKDGDARVNFSPVNKDYAISLNFNEIQDLQFEKSGENYIVTLTLPDAVNPDNSTSVYSKLFTVITLDDVQRDFVATIPGGAEVASSDITITYTGSYAKATLNPQGQLLEYEQYIRGDLQVVNATYMKFMKGIELTAVVSTTYTYKDFVW